MKAEIKDGKLVLTLDINAELEPSTSGKTLVVASTHGTFKTGLKHNGKEICISSTAYIKR